MAWSNTPGQVMALPTLTKEQIDLQNNQINQLQQQLGQQNPTFEPIRNNALRTYESRVLPGLTRRLTSLGTPLSSSAYQSTVAGGYQDLLSNLGAQEQQFNLAQQGNLNNSISNALGNRSFENIYQPPQQGFKEALAPGAAAAGTSWLLNKADQYFNQPQQQGQQEEQPGVGQQVAGKVAGTAAGAATTAALTAGGKAAAATAGGLGAKLGAAATAVLGSWMFWVPVLIAGTAAGGYGTYWLYNKYKNSWSKQRLSNKQAAIMKEEGLKQQQAAQQAQQGQPDNIGQRLQQFTAPSFA